jgi:hypothetical protein
MKDLNLICKELKQKTLLKVNNLWKNSPFEYLITTGLSPDDRGRWGENFIHDIIQNYTHCISEWMSDTNIGNADGSIFDMLVNSLRVEVKTATSGVNRRSDKLTYTFQHENIYEENVWDKLVLLDVEPNGFYITVINHKDMVFGNNIHPIFKKKSTKHLSGWKFDMSRASLKRGIENGLTIYLSVDGFNSNRDALENFLKNHFS